jgi:hypothetical protein
MPRVSSFELPISASHIHLLQVLPLVGCRSKTPTCPSFYRPRREQFTGVLHCSPTCEGMVSSATELTTVLANLATVGASWRVLCPYRSGFEDGGVEVGCPAAVRGPARGCRQRGAVRDTTAGVAMSCPRAPQQRWGCRRSTRCGAAVVGMAAQG